ncbi:hypothetical protein EBU99_06440 [bacterium]|nr:hypothetical protein [bacterium]
MFFNCLTALLSSRRFCSLVSWKFKDFFVPTLFVAILAHPVNASASPRQDSQKMHLASKSNHKKGSTQKEHYGTHGDAPKAHPQTGKKGVGLAEKKGFSQDHLRALNVAWYYNWDNQTSLETDVEFIPMIFSIKSLQAKVSSTIVLGFNEPDNSKQSDIPVSKALEAWPSIVAKGQRIGGPAMAGNPVKGDWLPAFMAANPKIDFVTVHWYKGANAKKFIKDLEEVFALYKKPLWVTEFAPQTAASSKENPDKISQNEMNSFIDETTRWMNQSSIVERYAWHDSRVGRSSLFNEKGELTDTGRAYAQVK